MTTCRKGDAARQYFVKVTSKRERDFERRLLPQEEGGSMQVTSKRERDLREDLPQEEGGSMQGDVEKLYWSPQAPYLVSIDSIIGGVLWNQEVESSTLARLHFP